jgi:hypothetical protein
LGSLVIASFIRRTGGRGPVLILRVIKAELDALPAALGREFLQRIALEGGSLDDIELVHHDIGVGIAHGENHCFAGQIRVDVTRQLFRYDLVEGECVFYLEGEVEI